MIVHQLSIFAENKPGSLARVTSILAREKVNIRATTIATSDTFGVISLIVDDPERACRVLTAEGLMVNLKDVIAVVIDDRPGGLDSLIQLLFKEQLNINNAYGFVLESSKTAVFVVDVDQIERAQELIEQGGYKLLDSQKLSSV